jgi:hypothetical protein
VPVSFGATVVSTDNNGIASYQWSATPGTTLNASVPNEANEVAPSCPTDIPSHAENAAYRPLVCFSPSSVTFTAVQPIPTGFGSGAWSYKQISNSDPVPSPSIAPLASDGWAVGQGPFASNEHSACPSLAAPGTVWSLNSTMLLRRDVFIPANTTSATIDLLIDNDIQVFVNGFDVSSGLVQHENCADILPPGPLTIPASAGPASSDAPLVAGQVNKILIRGVDRGVQSFLDVKMTLSSGGGL